MSLSALFEPKRVVVIGLDDRPPTPGRRLAERLAGAALQGELLLVGPQGGKIGAVSVVAQHGAPPGPVDLLVVAGDPRDTVTFTELWLARGVGAVLIAADPRADLDTEAPEERLRAACREAGARLVGPRSRGVVAPARGLVAVASDVPVVPGPLALASSAGGAAFTDALAAAHAAGVGIHEAIDLGAARDVALPELLLRWKADPRVHVIAIDGLATGGAAALVSALRATARVKPVVIHGPDAALLTECGAISAPNRVALAALCARLADPTLPRPRGPRVAIVTPDEALGALAVAATVAQGLTVAELEDATLRAVASEVHTRSVLGPALDLLAGATARHLTVAARAAAADPNVDAVLVAVDPAPAWLIVGEGPTVPIVPTVPILVDRPEAGIAALAALWRAAEATSGPPAEAAAPLPARALPQLAQAVMVAAHLTGRATLTPDEARRALMAYGVPTLPAMAVAAPHAARRAAASFGYPVSVTLWADGRPRRAVDLGDGDALEAAVVRLYEEAASADPRLAFEVQPAVCAAGLELTVAAHPRLGHRVTLRHAGRDAAALLPIGPSAARRLAEAATPELDPADHAELADLVARLARLCTDLPELARVHAAPLARYRGRWVVVDAEVTIDPLALQDERN